MGLWAPDSRAVLAGEATGRWELVVQTITQAGSSVCSVPPGAAAGCLISAPPGVLTQEESVPSGLVHPQPLVGAIVCLGVCLAGVRAGGRRYHGSPF